ncbi:MAG: hypothetical protein AMJ75_10445 [Phycisphaerae bacterium SM1_79]|nr:MAG: hypothetical protein AMJ75_10445 [Phycisphaerae bacterium SM1_79]
MRVPEKSSMKTMQANCPYFGQNQEDTEGCPLVQAVMAPYDYRFTEASVGAIQAGADPKRTEPDGVIAVLAEITMNQVKMKRTCSLAIAGLGSADLGNATTALQFLNPVEKAAPLDIGEARIRLLKHVRQARSPELIEQLHHALQTAAIIPCTASRTESS